MRLEVKNLVKSYGDIIAVNDVSFQVESGGILALVGPSGCGKTTLLKAIGGLLHPEKGNIYLDGDDITNTPANKRPTVTVFQDYALFPHMTVYDNIAYGLKNYNVKRKKIEETVHEYMSLMKIEELKKRKVTQLSGGQKQRVALARSMAINPKVILFDEPLSSLDAKLKVEMREEVVKIQRHIGITSIYVTHDQEEALAVADRIAIMKEGVLEQVGTPEEVYQRPKTTFVADFIGFGNFTEGIVKSIDENYLRLQIFEKDIKIEKKHVMYINYLDKDDIRPGKVKVFFRPEHVTPSTEERKDENKLLGKIIQKNFLGAITRYLLLTSNNEEIKMDTYPLNGPQSMGFNDEINFKISKLYLFH